MQGLAAHLRLRDAKRVQLLEGHVDAVALERVLADVAQDVGQLVRGAQRQRRAVYRLRGTLQGLTVTSSRCKTCSRLGL